MCYLLVSITCIACNNYCSTFQLQCSRENAAQAVLLIALFFAAVELRHCPLAFVITENTVETTRYFQISTGNIFHHETNNACTNNSQHIHIINFRGQYLTHCLVSSA